MFLRTIHKKNGKRYCYIFKSVYDKKRKYPVHKRIADLSGFSDEVILQIEKLIKGELSTFENKKSAIQDFVRISESRYFGPLRILKEFLDELEFEKLSFFDKRQIRDLKALILARAAEPLKCRSEFRTAEWLKNSGMHFLLGGDAVQWDRNRFYPLLSLLSKNWVNVEDHLWTKRESAPRLYFYDITSTYFEGKGGTLANLGYSRDEKNGNVQILVALLTDENSIPVSVRILPGNTKDSTTVKEMVSQIKFRFNAEKITIIMDRGMRTEANIETIKNFGLDYIIALPHGKARELLKDKERLEWEELFDQRSLAEWTDGNKRYVVCRNPFTAEKDKKTLEKILLRAEKRLNKLSEMIKKGRLLNKDKILARTIKILTQTKTEKYFDYIVDNNKLEYSRNELAKITDLYAGSYVLESSLLQTDKKEIDSAYRSERDIEEIFRTCKDELKLRPNFHKNDETIFGHIYLTFLSYLLRKKLEIKLKRCEINESAETFLQKFENITINRVEINKDSDYLITTPNRNQIILLNLLGIKMDYKKRGKACSLTKKDNNTS